MNRLTKSVLGVTLLEILLVLAIAAMIIVMSIRYYESAQISEQTNMTMEEIQAITSAADNLAIGSGSYSAASQTSISALIGSANLISPTGGTIAVTPTGTATYTVSIPVNTAICTSVSAKLAAIPKATSVSCSSGTLSYTYNNAN